HWLEQVSAVLQLSGATPEHAELALFAARDEDFELQLQWTPDASGAQGRLTYSHKLFDRDGAQRYAGYLRRAARALVDDDCQPLDRIELIDAAEQQLLRQWNQTATDFPATQCVHHLFEAQVARTPDALALSFEDRQLSYAELNRLANRLAHHLIELGVGPDARVAICAERGIEMVVGLYAILKAGGAYVLLDPGYPRERLLYQLQDCTPALLLTQRSLQPLLADAALPTLCLDDLPELPALEHDPQPQGLTAQHLAYVIYTSGSTGRPKGVMNQHDGVVNRLQWGLRQFGFGADDRVLQKTPFGFDVSVWEFFTPLAAGSHLRMARPGGHQDPHYLAERIQADAITAIHFVPSMLQAFLDQADLSRCAGLRHVMCSGEALSPALQNRFLQRLPGVALHNLYGPTEAAVEVSYWRCGAEPSRVPIGRPIANTRLYVVDRHDRQVPLGATGELLIGGVQVARGYWNRAELSAERFIEDPFVAGARVYRTGDLARWHHDGSIDYLGRNDFQVKIRGFRIELGEIEARLAEYPGIRETAVLAREDRPGDPRLVAYVCCDGEALDVPALRAHLGALLPSHMVPAAFVTLTRLPLSANGKLDRNALPAPDAEAYPTQEYEAPVGEVETALAQIWADVLKRERVGRHDDFFVLGGHSLLAMASLSRVRQTLGVAIALKDMFDHPVLADLAQNLDGRAPQDEAPIAPVSRAQPLPVSYAQQRLWFFGELDNGSEAYHIPFALHLRGALDRAALQRALDRIVQRHEALRTRFGRIDDGIVQCIDPPDIGFALSHCDLRGHAEEALQHRLHEEAGRAFDLQHGPVIRGQLIGLNGDEHVLAIVVHHIAFDGWSSDVFLHELGALYRAFSAAQDDPLPPLPVQYADYAVWQREWLQGDRLQKQSDYWREALAGAPALLELPTDRPRPLQQSFVGADIEVSLDAALTQRLKRLSQRHGSTLY
ncbi:MAG: amino acid adenylation domain-containing protein, partial [Lysobacter sp.]